MVSRCMNYYYYYYCYYYYYYYHLTCMVSRCMSLKAGAMKPAVYPKTSPVPALRATAL